MIYRILVALLVVCTLFADHTVVEDKNPVSILTPTLAKRETLKLRLSNGLEAYLISDPGLDKSGASLAVNRGSWSNPDEYLGLAHFLEHMLFLGTKKYPTEGGYQRTLDENAGIHNAYTDSDRTVYSFSVSNEAFPLALDMFAHFFIDPLFNPSGIQREVHAIDQEYAKNLQNDDWRTLYVTKTLDNPKHPVSRFDTGSLATISKIPQSALKEFYEKYYSANLMHLVVYSTLPMQELVKLIDIDFSPVLNKAVSPLLVEEPVFAKESLGTITYIEPYQDIRELVIQWELPRDLRFDAEVVSYALGYENQESLTQLLKDEELAEGVMVGSHLLGNALLYMLDINLTDKGVSQVDEVIAHCFEAIHLLQKEGISKTFFDEQQELARLAYEYQSRHDIFTQVTEEADQMIDESLETFPYKTRIPSEYNEKKIQEVLQALNPKTARYFVIARPELTGVKSTQMEPWFQVRYRTEKLLPELLQAWENLPLNPNIQQPRPNPYIPEHLSLLTTEEKKGNTILPIPQVLVATDAAKVFFREDDRLLLPEMGAIFRLHSPVKKSGDALSDVLLELYTKAAQQELNALRYEGSVAGLDFSLQGFDTGLKIGLHGYSAKALLFFQKMTGELKQFMPTEQQFLLQKEVLQKEYENAALDTPLRQSQEVLRAIMYKNFIPAAKKAHTLPQVTYAQLREFISSFFDQTYTEGVIFGNLQADEAREFYTVLQNTFHATAYPKATIPRKKVLQLDAKRGPFLYRRKVQQMGNACLLLLQDGCYDMKKRAALQILSQGMQEPFFSELRTKQQTGYLVASADQEMERELVEIFLVQSNTYDTCDLNARFELFLDDFLRDLETESFIEERFHTIQNSLVTQLSTPPKNMAEMLLYLDSLAFDYEASFDWIDKRVVAMKALTYPEFISFSQEFLGRSNKRRLSIQIEGILPEENDLHYTPIESLRKMRRQGSFKTAQENLCIQ